MSTISLYSFLNTLRVRYFYVLPLCLPQNMPIEIDSLLRMIDGFVTYQFWLIPLFCYFWPTRTNVKQETEFDLADSFMNTISRLPSTDNTASEFQNTHAELRQSTMSIQNEEISGDPSSHRTDDDEIKVLISR